MSSVAGVGSCGSRNNVSTNKMNVWLPIPLRIGSTYYHNKYGTQGDRILGLEHAIKENRTCDPPYRGSEYRKHKCTFKKQINRVLFSNSTDFFIEQKGIGFYVLTGYDGIGHQVRLFNGSNSNSNSNSSKYNNNNNNNNNMMLPCTCGEKRDICFHILYILIRELSIPLDEIYHLQWPLGQNESYSLHKICEKYLGTKKPLKSTSLFHHKRSQSMNDAIEKYDLEDYMGIEKPLLMNKKKSNNNMNHNMKMNNNNLPSIQKLINVASIHDNSRNKFLHHDQVVKTDEEIANLYKEKPLFVQCVIPEVLVDHNKYNNNNNNNNNNNTIVKQQGKLSNNSNSNVGNNNNNNGKDYLGKDYLRRLSMEPVSFHGVHFDHQGDENDERYYNFHDNDNDEGQNGNSKKKKYNNNKSRKNVNIIKASKNNKNLYLYGNNNTRSNKRRENSIDDDDDDYDYDKQRIGTGILMKDENGKIVSKYPYYNHTGNYIVARNIPPLPRGYHVRNVSFITTPKVENQIKEFLFVWNTTPPGAQRQALSHAINELWIKRTCFRSFVRYINEVIAKKIKKQQSQAMRFTVFLPTGRRVSLRISPLLTGKEIIKASFQKCNVTASNRIPTNVGIFYDQIMIPMNVPICKSKIAPKNASLIINSIQSDDDVKKNDLYFEEKYQIRKHTVNHSLNENLASFD